VAASFSFATTIPFSPENADETLRSVPALAGVFALYGQQENAEPYLTRAADLRRRMRRLLAPPESQSKRLNLRERVARIEYTVTGSEFESTLTLYHASAAIFGYAEARRRLRLHTPAFLRFAAENEFPRVYVTNKLSKRSLAQMYGPFPSRAAAERYCDSVLDLFKLRRCHEDLEPHPEHPGCVYGEMKKCLEPCKQACSVEQYAAEATAVRSFFETRGESMLARIASERERASEEMEFERAAELHEQHQRVKAAAALADEIVRPIPQLRAIVVQKAAPVEHREDEAALFLMHAGCLVGPERMSTLGVRAVKEQTSVGSSLFAQPLMLAAVPLTPEPSASQATPHDDARPETSNSPEERARETLARLEQRADEPRDLALLSDHLSLFRRWYYRPEKQRVGEAFLPNPDGSWPVRRILRGSARQVLGEPGALPDVQREAAKKMRVLHKGRPDVERVVPVVGKDG
jgi:excinuclease ABC subunit C